MYKSMFVLIRLQWQGGGIYVLLEPSIQGMGREQFHALKSMANTMCWLCQPSTVGIAFPIMITPIYGDYIKIIMYIYIYGNQKTPIIIIAYGVFSYNYLLILTFITIHNALY